MQGQKDYARDVQAVEELVCTQSGHYSIEKPQQMRFAVSFATLMSNQAKQCVTSYRQFKNYITQQKWHTKLQVSESTKVH